MKNNQVFFSKTKKEVKIENMLLPKIKKKWLFVTVGTNYVLNAATIEKVEDIIQSNMEQWDYATKSKIKKSWNTIKSGLNTHYLRTYKEVPFLNYVQDYKEMYPKVPMLNQDAVNDLQKYNEMGINIIEELINLNKLMGSIYYSKEKSENDYAGWKSKNYKGDYDDSYVSRSWNCNYEDNKDTLLDLMFVEEKKELNAYGVDESDYDSDGVTITPINNKKQLSNLYKRKKLFSELELESYSYEPIKIEKGYAVYTQSGNAHGFLTLSGLSFELSEAFLFPEFGMVEQMAQTKKETSFNAIEIKREIQTIHQFNKEGNGFKPIKVELENHILENEFKKKGIVLGQNNVETTHPKKMLL